MCKLTAMLASGCAVALGLSIFAVRSDRRVYADENSQKENINADSAVKNARKMISEGRHAFRFDTFGDEVFWGDALKLHEAIEGARFGGVGPGLSPRNALALGLKVDIDALLSVADTQLAITGSGSAVERGRIAASQMNTGDSAITLALLRANAVVGLTGFFNSSGGLRSIGIQCALCHSTTDDVVTSGIGHRLDGRANRDLNVGAIVALAPNLTPFADLLHVDAATVRKVLFAWGPGKFDAELVLDGKGFRPDGKSAATLIPRALGLAGINLHTWIVGEVWDVGSGSPQRPKARTFDETGSPARDRCHSGVASGPLGTLGC
jgi:hypothetical protein